MPRKPPSYRKHKASNQAIVTLYDAATGKRRDVYLGLYRSAESRRRYAAIVAQWEGRERQLPPTAKAGGRVTVARLIRDWWRHLKRAYPSGEYHNFRTTLRLLRALYGDLPADEFGPLLLQELRVAMLGKKWSRGVINRRVRHLQRMFRWAVGQELVDDRTAARLAAVAALRRGEQGAKEGRRIRPVSEAYIEAVREHVAPEVWAIIQLQLRTGARAGELLAMRPRDLDTTGKVWLFNCAEHKTAHHGHERTIFLGPEAQKILKPILREARSTEKRLFDYTTGSYRRAITRGCDKAFAPPPELDRRRVEAKGRKKTQWETARQWRERLGPEKWAELEKIRKAHRWHPHQLRHNAATALRREFGIEAARLLLGHHTAGITEIYAEADQAKARQIAGKIG